MVNGELIAWSYANLAVGDTLELGRYPQTEDGILKPLIWVVINCDERGVLVIAKEAIDNHCFHETTPTATWAHSNLRYWLNGEFLQSAFTPAEQLRLKSVQLDNSNSAFNSDVSGGPPTEDHIFLLSHAEADRYFATTKARTCKCTPYAAKRGVWVDNDEGETQGYCGWWLRSPGLSASEATRVSYSGEYFASDIHFSGAAVRPALMLAIKPNLESASNSDTNVSTHSEVKSEAKSEFSYHSTTLQTLEPSPAPKNAQEHQSPSIEETIGSSHTPEISEQSPVAESYRADNSFQDLPTDPITPASQVSVVQDDQATQVSAVNAIQTPQSSTVNTVKTSQASSVNAVHTSQDLGVIAAVVPNSAPLSPDAQLLFSELITGQEYFVRPKDSWKPEQPITWWHRWQGIVLPAIRIISLLIAAIVTIWVIEWPLLPYCGGIYDQEANWQVGDTFTLGQYPQNVEAATKPIEWQVIDRQGDDLWVISKYALSCLPYHNTLSPVLWSQSSVRNWLNGSFLAKAFNSGEQALIRRLLRANTKSRFNGQVAGGPDTEDRIFLLSHGELADLCSGKVNAQIDGESLLRCQPTNVALAQGVRITKSGDCSWWLRSPGQSNKTAALVHSDGSVISRDVNRINFAVRPSMIVTCHTKSLYTMIPRSPRRWAYKAAILVGMAIALIYIMGYTISQCVNYLDRGLGGIISSLIKLIKKMCDGCFLISCLSTITVMGALPLGIIIVLIILLYAWFARK